MNYGNYDAKKEESKAHINPYTSSTSSSNGSIRLYSSKRTLNLTSYDDEGLQIHQRRGPGLRNTCTAMLLFFGGLAMSIFGAIYYWNNNYSGGLDVFICGLIMLLPGCYGMTLLIGYYCKWHGYDQAEQG